MGSHFNAGRNSNNKAWLNLEVDCGGAYGPIKAFGRLWGEDQIDGLQTAFARNPGGIYRLRGFMSQFLDGRTLTNFAFYRWEPAPGQAPRAAFVLRGDCFFTGFEKQEGVHLLGLTVKRPGQGKYGDKEEDFKLYVPDPAMLAGIAEGDQVEAKGFLQKGDGEDEFGVSTGLVRPCCKLIRRCN